MRLRVATLNVWALPEPIARDVDARVGAIGERLQTLALDVVALQEVWSRDVADRLLAAGQRAGLRHGWFGNGAFGRGGLLVMSRLPIVKRAGTSWSGTRTNHLGPPSQFLKTTWRCRFWQKKFKAWPTSSVK